MKFAYLDVGARGGLAAKEGTRRLRQLRESASLIAIGVEPDWDECKRLGSSDDYDIILPVALWSEAGRRRLFVTERPALSSLFMPNMPQLSSSRKAYGYRVREILDVECVTMDSIAGGYDLDVVKLNVQGSTHEILLGGTAALESSVAVQLDLFFDQLYAGQRLFQETHDLLHREGFSLGRLSCPNDNGFVSQGIFTYYRDPASLPHDKNLKAIVVSSVLGDHDYAKRALLVHLSEYSDCSCNARLVPT